MQGEKPSMLLRLYIRNIALIKEAEIVPKAGLTVITGETGAGKSMLMDALSLSLGKRAESALLRKNTDEAMVEAIFSVDSSCPMSFQMLLDSHGILLEDKELILRRILKKDGTSRAFANGARLTLAQMAQIGESLADIHGQHDHQLLLRSACHAEILDCFGGLKKERNHVQKSYIIWKKLFDNLEKARSRVLFQEREKILLTAYLEELEALHYNKDEEIHLTEEKKRLMAAENITDALQQVVYALNGEQNFLMALGTAERVLSSISHITEDIEDLANRLSSIVAETNEMLKDTTSLAEHSKPNDSMLMEVDNRLMALKDVARKHRVDISDLPKLHCDLQKKLDDLTLLQEGLEDLEEKEKSARILFTKACNSLSAGRKVVAKNLVAAVEEELSSLMMPHMRFQIKFTDLSENDWYAAGSEKIAFLVSSNPGSSFLPLHKVASGGEVSRLMLALKTVFYITMPPMTLIFDEIDTGVGGAVADAVGDALAKLGQKHQVMAITHQPQVAAKGETHIKISKLTDGKNTATIITQLNMKKRQEELARMLSGKKITVEARTAAASLLKISQKSAA